MAMYKDKYERLWLAIKDAGIIIYDIKTGREYCLSQPQDLTNKIQNNRINCIFSIGNKVYFGTSGLGLLYTELIAPNRPFKELLRYRVKNADLNQYITTSFKDKNGNRWVGSPNGIIILDSLGRYNSSHYLQKNLSQNHMVCAITSDKDGNIWVGTKFGGIFKCKLTDKTLEYKRYIIEQRSLCSLFTDSQNRIWTTFDGGDLMLFDKSSDQFIKKNNDYNLSINSSCNIFEDAKNNIWLYNSNSLIMLDNNGHQKHSVLSTHCQNMLNKSCNIIAKGNNSYILGGFNGITLFNANKNKKSKNNAPLIITDIEINQYSIFNSLNKGIQYKNNHLVLSRKNNNISVKFAALQYNNATNIDYAYKLDGFDSQWNYIGAYYRQAKLKGLPKGEYVLNIKATNEDGIWSDEVTKLHIKILPSPFNTWWAYILYITTAILLTMTIYRIVMNRIILQKKLSQAEFFNQQNEILTQQKLQFFTNISHELLTPLTIIGCAAEELAKTHNKDGYVDIMRNNIERLIRLIRQILEFRKSENDKLKLQVSKTDITEFINEICEKGFLLLAQQKNIRFKIDLPNEAIIGWIDTDKLDKILYNILANAFKYNIENSYVSITIHSTFSLDGERNLIISVKDGGIGIAPENLSNIFTRFYDGMYRQTKTQGSGIGLSLTKSLVELHKGKIEVNSELGQGSEFIVTIPIDKTPYKDNITEASTRIDIGKNKITNSVDLSKTLLIVEDNDDLLNLMISILGKYYTVVSAKNGLLALETLKNRQIDMVISDIMMPELDGIELCKKIKSQSEEFSDIPVILLSAKEQENDRIKGYECGADAYITKPFKNELLLSRINNLFINRKKHSTNTANSILITATEFTPQDKKTLQKAVEIIHNNISNEDFSFDTFADDMKISKSTLYRKIKSLTGMTTSDFIKDIRLRQAAELLKADKNITISEVAYSVGFGQPKYFSTCFKKKYGVLPSEYFETENIRK